MSNGPPDRCSFAYIYATDTNTHTQKVIKNLFPKLPLTNIHIPNFYNQIYPIPSNTLFGILGIMTLSMFCWLLVNAWKYGYKEKYLRGSFTVFLFYVFGIAKTLTDMCFIGYESKLFNNIDWYFTQPDNVGLSDSTIFYRFAMVGKDIQNCVKKGICKYGPDTPMWKNQTYELLFDINSNGESILNIVIFELSFQLCIEIFMMYTTGKLAIQLNESVQHILQKR